MPDLAGRLANRMQLTTDGHKAYLEAVEGAFGADIDYAMLVKIYGESSNAGSERKYSPNVCLGAHPIRAPEILTCNRSAHRMLSARI